MVKFITIITALAAVSGQVITKQCANEWGQMKDYTFVATPMTWAAAEANCASLRKGGHLAVFHTLQENQCVLNTVFPQVPVGDNQAWIGFSDEEPYSPLKMDFRWVDGSSVYNDFTTFSNWNAGEPNPATDEGCGRMYGPGAATIAGKWNDDTCTKTAPSICSFPADACPGTSRTTGKFTKMNTCPPAFTAGVAEKTLQAMCETWCDTQCPPGSGLIGATDAVKAIYTLASPGLGQEVTCACYTDKRMLYGDVARMPIGGCAFVGTQGDTLSAACSKALWSFPRTRYTKEFDIGFGFGPPDVENPYGDGTYTDAQTTTMEQVNEDAQWSVDSCIGETAIKFGPKVEPCYNTYKTQTPAKCTCPTPSNHTAVCKTVMESKQCNLDLTFRTSENKYWTANNLVSTCFPAECTIDDVNALTKYITNEWIDNSTLPDAYELSSVTASASCMKSGGGGGSSAGKDAGIAIGVIACLGLAAAGVFFVKKRRDSNGLNTKFLTRHG